MIFLNQRPKKCSILIFTEIARFLRFWSRYLPPQASIESPNHFSFFQIPTTFNGSRNQRPNVEQFGSTVRRYSALKTYFSKSVFWVSSTVERSQARHSRALNPYKSLGWSNVAWNWMMSVSSDPPQMYHKCICPFGTLPNHWGHCQGPFRLTL